MATKINGFRSISVEPPPDQTILVTLKETVAPTGKRVTRAAIPPMPTEKKHEFELDLIAAEELRDQLQEHLDNMGR